MSGKGWYVDMGVSASGGHICFLFTISVQWGILDCTWSGCVVWSVNGRAIAFLCNVTQRLISISVNSDLGLRTARGSSSGPPPASSSTRGGRGAARGGRPGGFLCLVLGWRH